MLLQPITVQFSKSTLKPSVYTLTINDVQKKSNAKCLNTDKVMTIYFMICFGVRFIRATSMQTFGRLSVLEILVDLTHNLK